MSEENIDNTQHKRELREEGKIEVPLMIDPARYFIGDIRVKDLMLSLPALAVSLFILYIIYQTGSLRVSTGLFSLLPFILVFTFFIVKHPDRKNISFMATIWWQIKHKTNKNLFEYTRRVEGNLSEDIRSQLGIYNVGNDCLETLDNRLCKVLRVPSINLQGLSDKERDRVLKSYQSFIQELPVEIFPIQTHQFSQPINLSSYLEWVRDSVSKERDKFKRLLAESYIEKGNEIQKAKSMVNKERYIIVSQKIGTNKNKAIEKVSLHAEQVRSSLQNTFSSKYEVEPKILNNDELFQYIYACIDYENAQIRQEQSRGVNLPFSISKDKFEEISKDGEIKDIS